MPTVAWNPELFSDSARLLLQRVAPEKALQRGHNYVGVGEILLALLTNARIQKLLKALGVDPQKMKSDLEFVIGRREKVPDPAKEIGLTPRVKRVLELAVDEARGGGARRVDEIHLLIGLIREGEETVAWFLGPAPVSLEKVRDYARLHPS